MRLISMKATFGSLEGSVLELEPGLNRICAPNEWGKSTWCAFLTAMLYGVDTRERTAKDRLAVKERYAPWSGKPMEGEVVLEHGGRTLVLRRWSEGRQPFSGFEARDAETGTLIRELTGSNCGQTLLGVERSVFARSGFIRFQDMPVTEDEALRRRLNALVTTGDESEAADRLARRLRELKNKCRYHKTGLIPQCQTQLDQLERQLENRQALQLQQQRCEAEEAALEEELTQLRLHRKWLRYYAAREQQRRAQEAQELVDRQAQRLAASVQTCRSHPKRQELEEKLAAAPLPKKPGALPFLLAAAVLAAAAAILLLRLPWYAAAAAGALAFALMLLGLLRGRTYRKTYADLQQQRQLWSAALEDWQRLEQDRGALEQARTARQLLQELVQDVPQPEEEDPCSLDEEQTRSRMRLVRDRIGASRLSRGEALGRMEALPPEAALEQQLEQCRRRLEELQQYERALGYAQKALEEAMERLHHRFAPRITRRAQQLLERLTDGRYDRLFWSEELALTAAARDETVQRSSLWRSDGTADQMYLALRIAVWEELTPDTPLILDDALVRFDQSRLDAAFRLLEELAQEHQIVVFSCR